MIPTEQDSPQRSATRASVDAPIKMQFDDSLDVVEGRCYNISIGGMFAESDSTRPQGSLVRFELLLGDDASVRGLGEIVWAQEAMPGRRASIGLKFRFLEQRDRQAIFKLVSQHIKEKLAQRPSMVDEPPVPDTPLARQRRATLLGEGLAPMGPPEDPYQPEPESEPAEPARPSRSGPIISAGEPLPHPLASRQARERPLEERTWQQPTMQSGSSAARPGRTVDPAWLDDDAGFADEPESPRNTLPLKPGVVDDWDDRPIGSSVEEEPHFLSDVDPDHFEHRPRTKEVPWLIIGLFAALLLVLLFLYYYFLRPPRPDAEQVLHIPAGSVSPDAGRAQPKAEPPPLPDRRPEPEPQAVEPRAAEPKIAEPKIAEPKAAEPKAPEPKAPEPKAPEPKAPEPKAPEPKAAEPKATAAKEFTKVLAISTRQVSGGLEIVIEGDGAIPESRVGKSRLEGREVLNLYGVAQRFDLKEIAVAGNQWVKGLRIGYHQGGTRGDEVRIVIDLASPSAKIARVKSEGKSLIVRIATD